MKGILTQQNKELIIQETKTIKNCFGCKSYDVINKYPIHPHNIEQLSQTYINDEHETIFINLGKVVEFEIVISALDFITYAKLIPMAEQTNGERFEELIKTTEGLCDAKPPYVSDDFQIGPDGAYEHQEPEKISWNELFTDLESKLDVYVPLRAINYIKNNYKKPKRKK